MLYVMEITEKRLKIVFSSVTSSITEVIDDAIEFLEINNFAYESFSLKLVLAEAITNAVKHGNSFNPHLNTVFSLDISDDKLMLIIEDQGDGFDWKKLLQSTMPDEEKLSGRGLALMQAYGYRAEYNEVGNRLTLTRV